MYNDFNWIPNWSDLFSRSQKSKFGLRTWALHVHYTFKKLPSIHFLWKLLTVPSNPYLWCRITNFKIPSWMSNTVKCFKYYYLEQKETFTVIFVFLTPAWCIYYSRTSCVHGITCCFCKILKFCLLIYRVLKVFAKKYFQYFCFRLAKLSGVYAYS